MANIRTIDYSGSNSASAGTGPKGWMFWSGSETIGGQAYSGLGMEMMDTSESYLKFTTEGGGDLDIRAKKFYVGSPTTQFISGSGGDIEISSSNFHLTNTGLVIGSGTVINADLSVNSLFVPAGKNANNAGAYIASDGNAKFVGDGSGNYAVDFSTSSAKIAGFEITSTAISASGLHLSSSGEITGSKVKFTGGDIAGWALSADKLTASNIILSSSGTIQTTDFQPSLLGTGKGWKIGSDGVAEFEEARIRGTLSTAVFEKDTISAVGGQVIIANATTITGSEVTYSGGAGTLQTINVANAGGFVHAEFLIAKATASSGFTTEKMLINSVDSSSTPNTLTVLRNVNQSTYITTMSSGQVLVSQGAINTGYIHMNADPGDATTPYIDIVERTGSGVDDIEVKARLGDLSGLAGVGPVSADPGFGLYSENVFLSGTITASAGKIGGWSIGATKLSTGGFEIAASGSNDYAISSSNFTVKHNGLVAAANFAEKFVTVTADNSGSYFADMTNYNVGQDGVRLLFDGSGGGEVTMNMQLDVAPTHTTEGVKPIADIKLPLSAAGVKMEATVIINTGSVQFDETQIFGGYGGGFLT